MYTIGSPGQADKWFQWFHDKTARVFSKDWPENVPKARVAIIDTGIDESHVYVLRRWVRPRFCIDGSNLVDRGYIDLVGNLEPGGIAVDPCGHGTHMAGIILQLTPHAELYVAHVFESSKFSSSNTTDLTVRIAKVMS